MAKRLIVEYLEQKNDHRLYKCETCSHYSNGNVCSECHRGSRWAFEKTFDNYDKEDFEMWKRNRL